MDLTDVLDILKSIKEEQSQQKKQIDKIIHNQEQIEMCVRKIYINRLKTQRKTVQMWLDA